MFRCSRIVVGFVLAAMPVFLSQAAVGQDAAEPPAAPPTVVGLRVISGGDGNVVVQNLSGDELGGAIAFTEAVGGMPGMSMSIMSAGGEDPTSLLNLEQIQSELELIDPQIEQIRKLQSDMRQRQSDLMRRVAKDGLRQPDVMAAMQDELKEMRERTRAEIEKLLLPHQADRLQQVARQVRMQRRGAANGLMGGELAAELGLTDDQKARLKERAKEIEDELQREIVRLRKKAEEKILGELTPAQQAKLQQLLGKQIDVKTPAFKAPLPTYAPAAAGSK